MPNIIPPFKLNYEYLDKLHSDKEYQTYKPEKISGRRYEHIQISSDSTVFRLKDKSQLDIVSLVVIEKVNFHGTELYEIKLTKSSTQRRKFLSYLFDLLLVEFEFKIVSDKIHTSPGSKEFWIKLGKKKIHDLYIYNTDTNYKRKYENVSDEKIWGLSSEYLEEINSLFLEIPEFDLFEFEDSELEDNVYEFEGFEDIDLTVLDSSIATKEIYAFANKYKGRIKSREEIRLIAQKTTTR